MSVEVCVNKADVWGIWRIFGISGFAQRSQASRLD